MKLYQDKAWLYNRYIIQKKNIVEIAKECGVSIMTIQRYIDKFSLKIKR
jgi:DNA-directed RNA polymerase specialized sigma subunit